MAIIGKLSLRTRLFIAMIFLLFISGTLILVSTLYQYRSQSDDYHDKRLERKEAQIKRHLNYLVAKNNLYGKPDSIWMDFLNDFKKIETIHKVQYSLFSTSGAPIHTSYQPLKIIANNYQLQQSIRDSLFKTPDGRFIERSDSGIEKYQSTFSLLKDGLGRPYGILFFPYFQDVSYSEDELNTFLQRLYEIYVFLLIGAILTAYFLSLYVTRSLEKIRVKMDQTGLLLRNEKIHLNNATKEIDSLVNSYNRMIDDLNDSAEKLAKNEREQAWQEMARQVAHEIKNPLTPMRLTIQNFQQRFKKNDPNNTQKINDFSKLLIEQIDTMSNVAEAFSDFATLPKPNKKTCDLVEVTKLAIEIFNEEYIVLETNVEQAYHQLDRTQWIRVMTNLIQNALQAVPDNKTPNIRIEINVTNSNTAVSISDNGSGIEPSIQDKIFEPKFTTKTAGMGLGLGIVKNIIRSHDGRITYVSTPKKGTIFTIILKK